MAKSKRTPKVSVEEEASLRRMTFAQLENLTTDAEKVYAAFVEKQEATVNHISRQVNALIKLRERAQSINK